jgi:hypothetical protein
VSKRARLAVSERVRQHVRVYRPALVISGLVQGHCGEGCAVLCCVLRAGLALA